MRISDWSSDVCSSDLIMRIANDPVLSTAERLRGVINQLMSAYDQHYPHMYVYIQEEMNRIAGETSAWAQQIISQTRKFERIVMGMISELIERGEMRSDIPVSVRAEERRVGKECVRACRYRWGRDDKKN